MAYITNPNIGKVRLQAVRLVREGASIRQTAKHFGYTHGAVRRWLAKAVNLPSNIREIPTESSRPYHHPLKLPSAVVERVLALRSERRQCAQILHYRLKQEGVVVSLVSVKRILKRYGCSRYSRWKKWHSYPPRPTPEKPGILVQIDSIVDGPHTDRLYVYTLLDVCSRVARAIPSLRINTHRSLGFVENSQILLPFRFQTIQSDHGAEFSKWFTKRLLERGMSHRHSRVRTPNDNAHLERFNRTLQEECLDRVPRNLKSWQKEIPEYLRYYNEERPHMGLGMKTPIQILTEVDTSY